ILPTVKEHGEPLAKDIGRELWDRASVWRFGKSFIKDKLTFDRKDYLKREWERFVKDEAVPVLESHADEFVDVLKRIGKDLADNQRLRDEMRSIGDQVMQDDELRDLMKDIFNETIVQNRELRQVWSDNWRSDDAKAALRLAGKRLEPVVREIGDDLFGTRETGINPAFARVLRNQILGKDKRWVVVSIPNSMPRKMPGDLPRSPGAETSTYVSSGRAPMLVAATEKMVFPLTIMAGKENAAKKKR
ncbi:MAG: hypothetical protein AAFN70_09670, partial [Planctomycetota bacterium]